MARSKIEWLARPGTIPESWNPVTGCSAISKGCRYCYAARGAATRLRHNLRYEGLAKLVNGRPVWSGEVRLHEDLLDKPLRWKKERTVFVCSMSDWLHPDVPFSFAAKMFAVLNTAKQHTFLLLTKRADRLLPFFNWAIGGDAMPLFEWPSPHVWLGVTVENQRAADERLPLLLQTPAAVRFGSFEPLLGPIGFVDVAYSIKEFHGKKIDGLTLSGLWDWLHWVIVGGESGHGARPMHPNWARSLRDQCQAAGTPYFFKQHGAWLHESQMTDGQLLSEILRIDFGKSGAQRIHEWPDGTASYHVGKRRAGRLLDGREWNEWPN